MYVCLWGASERKLGKSLNHRIISGCDSPDHKNGAEPALQTCIEVLPNVVRAFRGALPLHPIAPVQPFLRWQPGLCNEERHSNELDNLGGAAPPPAPPRFCVCTVLVIPYRV